MNNALTMRSCVTLRHIGLGATQLNQKRGQIYVCHEQGMCNCTRDGRRPPEVSLQGQASNRPVLLRLRGVVVSDWGKGVQKERQVSTGKMSASEPLKTHRESLKTAVRTEGDKFSQDEPEGDLFTDQAAAGVKTA